MSISVAYWCVFIAAVLPYVWVGIAKAGARGYDNRDPRGWASQQQDVRRRRAHAAHMNAFEAFPAFAAGVVLADLAGVADATIAQYAIVFIAARLLHGAFYLTDMATLRSVVWLVGIASSLGLIVQAARVID